MAKSQTMAEHYATQTAEQLIGFGATDVTQAELTALREYATRIAGTPDTFDLVDDERNLDHLQGIAPLLDDWAEALRVLADDTSNGVTGNGPSSDSCDLFLKIQQEAFADTRDALLWAIAASVDIRVTRWRSW